ncbi:RedB protein OS=Stigmatella aurantiaca (strain DW4/3-1) GN=redB PE=4 SV=1 [Gemmata massiliana]|uniref:RedB protein n=1 Tax=Gemmata massiliana TaxID=1210884 RepID=A0A6P2DG62_9BACT|nr:RedB protein [Gemmata massiliana]VTR98764.1 RedB protein OS=Stigmatella aurantiaca (strain DW4/3-1) GN=redB PE=4 SV=1 [Gemmata massiliana]
MARNVTAWLIGFVWLAAILTGFWVWERYDATPGTVGAQAPAADDTAPERWRLTVFVHPRCPCTRAALGEVAEIVRAEPNLLVRILFVRPEDARDGWERGESWGLATRIPGAEVGLDEAGTTARRFGAETSGHAVLTDPAGGIVYRGGLTVARGRAGASPGRAAVLDWIGGRDAPASTPVFGCPLFTP